MTVPWRNPRVMVALLAGLILLAGAAAVFVQGLHPPGRPCGIAATGAGFAVDGGFADLTPAETDAEFGQMRAAGATWVRLDAVWSAIEPEPDAYDWSSSDRVVTAARSHGLRVLLLLTYAPAWARPPGTSDHGGPVTPAADAAFGRFARAAAARYGPAGVTAYEVWNEPNVPQFWEPRADAAAYSRLLVAAAAGIRAVQPGATVVSGGLAPASDSGGAISPLAFTADLYADGAGGSFDALGVHPYAYPYLPLAPGTLPFNAFQRSALLREVMVEHGQPDKRVWFTEFGAPTGTARNSVSLKAQASAISQAFGQVDRWPWAGPLFVYELRDGGSDPADLEDNFGLRTVTDAAKPAYDAYRKAAVDSASRCAASVRST